MNKKKRFYFLWQQPLIKSDKISNIFKYKKINYNLFKKLQFLKINSFKKHYIFKKIRQNNYFNIFKVRKYKLHIYNKDYKKIRQNNILSSRTSYFSMKYFWFQGFEKSNQNTYLLERPLFYPLQWVQKGDLLGDCSASNKGELSLGQNMLVAYMPWEGFNFEDAVLINNSILKQYTSLHIEKYDLEILENTNEQITRNIPGASFLDLQNLDKKGIVKVGSWVNEGDILIGKIISIDNQNQKLITHEKLLYNILGQKKDKFQEKCLRVPQGVYGRIIRICYDYFESNKKKSSIYSNSKNQKLKKKYNGKKLQKYNLISYNFPSYIKNSQFPYFYLKYNFYKNEYFNFYVLSFKNDLKFNKNLVLLKKNYILNKLFSRLFQFDIKKIYRWSYFYKNKKLLTNLNILKKKEKKILIYKIYNKKTFLKNLGKFNVDNLFFFHKNKYKFSIFSNKFNMENFRSILYFSNKNDHKKIYTNSENQKNLKIYIKKNLLIYILNYNKKYNLLKQKSFSKVNKNLYNEKKNSFNNIKITNSIKKITIYIAEKREFQIGDKISGRHGNKGIISQILPNYDMPYLSNGFILEILLNPLGVPSRMNVGQILECLLGFISKIFHTKFQVLSFDEIYGYEASRSFIYSKLFEIRQKTSQRWLFSKKNPGKFHLFDGRTGQLFNQSIMVGSTYMMKLIHIVDEKIHARSTGPYSLVTQQPLRGRSKRGGQRIGEMEVWALQGYGCAYTLQELLTSKSDDMQSRNQILFILLKNKSFGSNVPESLRVVLRELQCLCLDLQLLNLK